MNARRILTTIVACTLVGSGSSALFADPSTQTNTSDPNNVPVYMAPPASLIFPNGTQSVRPIAPPVASPAASPVASPVYAPVRQPAPNYSVHSGFILKLGIAWPTNADNFGSEFDKNWLSGGLEYNFQSDNSPNFTPLLYLDGAEVTGSGSDDVWTVGGGIGTRVYLTTPTPNSALPYLTAGVGVYSNNVKYDNSKDVQVSSSNTALGFRAGVGVLLGDRFTIEGIYTDAGSVKDTPIRHTSLMAGIRF
ncbi:MAG: outer membrane beta-barrel protein [Capsulimonadaceae bacterium]|nr:outer membrane beta-barrel protein [Capsulimonadaceae bacterium]